MKKQELTLEIWNNGHVINAQLTDYKKEQALTIVSGKTEEQIFEQIGDWFLSKAGITRNRAGSNKKDSGVF